jgi:DeoR/GlpR family transcriptional regulator of sugar metabolism
MDGQISAKSVSPDDVILFKVEKFLTSDQRAHVASHLARQFPDNKCVVLDGGSSIGLLGENDKLDRIENKLDTLLELMAAILDTEEQEEVQLDLDGVRIPSGGNAGGTL